MHDSLVKKIKIPRAKFDKAKVMAGFLIFVRKLQQATQIYTQENIQVNESWSFWPFWMFLERHSQDLNSLN